MHLFSLYFAASFSRFDDMDSRYSLSMPLSDLSQQTKTLPDRYHHQSPIL